MIHHLLRSLWDYCTGGPGLYGYTLADEDGHDHLMTGKPRNPAYRAFRERMRQRYPSCSACGTQDHWQWHHKIPVAWPGGESLELEESNGLPLCATPSRMCHLNIGHLGDYSARNPNVTEDAKTILRKRNCREYPPAGA